MYKLYVIPGSHACRSAILMLDHKRVQYRRVDVLTLTHPVRARLHGFSAGGQKRVTGARRTLGVRLGDMLGTVPALDADGRKVSTNHGIARFLDEHHPDPPLLPDDPDERRAVEEAERWANEVLQMAARRLPAGALIRDPAGMARSSGDGRMGYLLYRSELARRLINPLILRVAFNVDRSTDAELLPELPGMLDRIDRWIEEGVLGREQLNVADFRVAPSRALMLSRSDLYPYFEGRPALDLVDRLLPEPGPGARVLV